MCRADAASTIRLLGSAISSTNSYISYQWAAVVADPNFTFNSMTLASDPTSPNLVITPNSLIQGFTYTFQISATDINGVGACQVMITTFRPPFGGTIAVDPLSGTSGVTSFTISLDGWRDDFTPAANLQYEVRRLLSFLYFIFFIFLITYLFSLDISLLMEHL